MSSRPLSMRGTSNAGFPAEPILDPLTRWTSSRGEHEVAVVLDVLHEAALLEDPGHHARQGRERERDPLRPVAHDPLLQVDVEVVPFVDQVRVDDDRGDPDVDAVPVEDARE